MKVILLAGGYGTRLRPFTNKTPKCLMPINGTPLLEIWLRRLTDAGLGPFLVNTHYLPEQVEQFVQNSKYRQQISLVHEPVLLGTAATLMENLSFYGDEDGLLIHADNFCLADLGAFLSAHRSRPRNCLMTMMTFRTAKPENCGIVEIDDHDVIKKFHEKVPNPPGNLANGAIYALSSELLKNLKMKYNEAKDFSTEIIPKLAGNIYSYETLKPLIDIGTVDAYCEINDKKWEWMDD